jgi:hypothetical protein
VPNHARTCLACAVRESALCHVLSPQQLTSLNHRSFRKHYAAGQLISGVSATEEWYATIVSGGRQADQGAAGRPTTDRRLVASVGQGYKSLRGGDGNNGRVVLL